MFTLITIIKCGYWKFKSQQSEKKKNDRHPNLKGRSMTVAICWWHDAIIENPKEFVKK